LRVRPLNGGFSIDPNGTKLRLFQLFWEAEKSVRSGTVGKGKMGRFGQGLREPSARRKKEKCGYGKKSLLQKVSFPSFI